MTEWSAILFNYSWKGRQRQLFINISNHPSANWSQRQIDEAKKFGEIVDYPFPVVGAAWGEEDICRIAEKVIQDVSVYKDAVLLIQGEYTLTYRLVSQAKELGIRVVAACSNRVTQESVNEDGTTTKISKFEFVQFRDY
jgi:hypothetical protein